MLEIRPFLPKDLAPVRALVRSAFGREYPHDFYLRISAAWPDGALVAKKGNRIVGTLLAVREKGETGRILIMAVETSHRGKHVGKGLLNSFISICQAAAIPSISLEVRSTNQRAIGFYLGFDFIYVATIDGYYEDGTSAYVLFRKL